MVDERMNCEDIAMNFLIAHISKKPPIKVRYSGSLNSTHRDRDNNFYLTVVPPLVTSLVISSKLQ